MAFCIKKKNGREYACEVISKWNKETKKYDRTTKYLGVLIDKQTRAYEKRYNVDKPQRYTYERQCKQEKLILKFGDSYSLSSVIRKSEIGAICENVFPNECDTLSSLLCFKILGGSAFDNADTWFAGSYAKLLFPKAELDGRRISEFLKYLGEEYVQRAFFNAYLSKTVGRESDVIIDSTGLPNEIDMNISQFGNHGGISEQETRLILVVEPTTKKPLYFRLVSGNIVDVSTLITTIAEFQKLGVKSTFSLLDGGYYSETNIKALYGNNISFMTRVSSNRVFYKDLIRGTAETLEVPKNVVRYNNRALFIERREVDLFGNNGFAYICCDIKRKGIESDRFLLEATDDKLSDDEIADKLKFKGKFILVSNRELSANDVIPLYYIRQSAEQLFGLGKSQLNFLPLRVPDCPTTNFRFVNTNIISVNTYYIFAMTNELLCFFELWDSLVHSEENLRGLLLLNFIALALQGLLQTLLRGKYSIEKAMTEMGNLYCKVYEDSSCIVQELTKKQKEILELLAVTTPNLGI